MHVPDQSPFSDFVRRACMDSNEVKAYTDFLPKLVEFEETKSTQGISEIKSFLPKVYDGSYSTDHKSGLTNLYIVMEDLSPDWHSVDPKIGLSFQQMTVAIQSMAR